ncbi:hypothetical protein QBC43DRAFT_117489 [Cladorrhinum sp. PSN259]|nr:hypothetical protein QBC43DRAFT_117489 [Cladorrhinum sp. PSN259]
MDPISAVGAVASVSQLLGLCVKAGKEATWFYESYTDAPDEIRRLRERITMLQYFLQQIDDFGSRFTPEQMEQVLPSMHRSIIVATLKNALSDLGSLKVIQGGSNRRRVRLRWAAVERSKAERTLRVTNDIDRNLTTCLAFANTRFQILNQLQASQTATLPALEALNLQFQCAIQAGFNHTIAELQDLKGTVSALQKRTMRDSLSDQPREQYLPRLGINLVKLQDDIRNIIDFEHIRAAMATISVATGRSRSWNYKSEQNLRPSIECTSSFRIGALARSQSRPHTKLLSAKLRIWLDFLGPRIVDFEMGMKIRLKALLSSDIRFSIRVINVQPEDSPIMRAFKFSDATAVYDTIRELIENRCAGINDVDDNGYSLLWRAGARENMRLVKYLLDCGADPNLGERLPLNVCIFKGEFEIAEQLIRSGADMYLQEHDTPDSHLPVRGRRQFLGGIQFLTRHDYWKWLDTKALNSTSGKIFAAATTAGSLKDIMTILDEFHYAIGTRRSITIRAVMRGRIEVVTILLKLKADIKYRPTPLAPDLDFPLFTNFNGVRTSMVHYLLLRGANAVAFWFEFCALFEYFYIPNINMCPAFRFQELEGMMFHIVLHINFDQITFNTNSPQTTIFYFAKLFGLYHDDHNHENVDRFSQLSDALEHATPDNSSISVTWSPRGFIKRQCSCPQSKPMPTGREVDSHYLTELGIADLPKHHSTPGMRSGNVYGDVYDDCDSPHYPNIHRVQDDGRDSIPFDKTTLFYDNISTERGRRQMSTYPMVRALCNAMQLAGYCVDMDDDGDIWFDCDDLERYQDAREYQPEHEDVVANCPICQDFEKHGLGYILRRAEVGERFVDEWRSNGGKGKATNIFGLRP